MRIPVVDPNHKPLMPTTPSRARRWVRDGKVVKRWSDSGQFYVQLTEPAKGDQTQDIAIGIDPGKHFSGIGVQSAKYTLYTAHLILPFKRVKERMTHRRMLRRSRRGRRINRQVSFKLRNHRQKRFDHRKQSKLPPSIRANRQLELRVVKELLKIFPVTTIYYEKVRADVDRTSGRKKAKSGKGFSPVMVGQKWMISELSNLAPTYTCQGWETANTRKHLNLVKNKSNKGQPVLETHAVDGVALAASHFVQWKEWHSKNAKHGAFVGPVQITPAPFKVISRPAFYRRQLHFETVNPGGIRKRKGGTLTPFGFRCGDLVKAEKANSQVMGWIGGFTNTVKTKNVSVYDGNWKRIGQYSLSKVNLIRRSTGLCVS